VWTDCIWPGMGSSGGGGDSCVHGNETSGPIKDEGFLV
jgi:hypothetical protein